MSRWVYILVWLEICLIPVIPHVLNHDWFLVIALYAALYGLAMVAAWWLRRGQTAEPGERFTSWIQRAYIRAVLFFIGPALRSEQESRAAEFRALGSQISIVVDEQISKYAARPHQPPPRTAEVTGRALASQTEEKVSPEAVP